MTGDYQWFEYFLIPSGIKRYIGLAVNEHDEIKTVTTRILSPKSPACVGSHTMPLRDISPAQAKELIKYVPVPGEGLRPVGMVN